VDLLAKDPSFPLGDPARLLEALIRCACALADSNAAGGAEPPGGAQAQTWDLGGCGAAEAEGAVAQAVQAMLRARPPLAAHVARAGLVPPLVASIEVCRLRPRSLPGTRGSTLRGG
jgi:hypothetical protein